MSLTGCSRTAETRIEFITPNIPAEQLQCPDRPTGQLGQDASNSDVAQKIIAIDEAGEVCRQRLDRVRVTLEVFNTVVAEMNELNKTIKD